MAHDPRRDLLDIFQAAVTAVDGRARTCDWLRTHPLTGPVYTLACGKAACTMAQGAHDVLGSRIQEALVITKHGATRPLPWPVIEAGHPVPDAASLVAGAQLLHFVSQLPSDAQVLVLLSGGASALVEALQPGLELEELQASIAGCWRQASTSMR